MSYFKEEINAALESLKKADAQGLSSIEQFENRLTEEEAYQKALRKGAKIPSFSLPDTAGMQVNIEDIYQKKFLVLVFYRGQWCPFCNLQLRDLQRSLSAVHGAPAELVAISPQKPDKSVKTKEKFNLDFTVLSDQGNGVARKFNIVYTLPEYLVNTYKGFGADIQYYNGEEIIELPFPATYVVNRQGVVVKDYIGANLSDRAEGKEIVDFLQAQL